MAGLQLITESRILPVTLTEIKQTLRLDPESYDQDSEIIMMMNSAIKVLEDYLGRSFINKTYDLYLDHIPFYHDETLKDGFSEGPFMEQKAREIMLPKSPVSSVTYIKYYDDSDTATTFATSNYYVDTINEPARIVLRRGQTFPDSGSLRVANAYQIRFISGYGAAAKDIPETLKQALNLYISHLYENREIYTEVIQRPIPMLIHSLLLPYRIVRFGSRIG